MPKLTHKGPISFKLLDLKQEDSYLKCQIEYVKDNESYEVIGEFSAFIPKVLNNLSEEIFRFPEVNFRETENNEFYWSFDVTLIGKYENADEIVNSMVQCMVGHIIHIYKSGSFRNVGQAPIPFSGRGYVKEGSKNRIMYVGTKSTN